MLLFFFHVTATTEIYTLSLHDALPILVTSAPLTKPPSATATPLGVVGRWISVGDTPRITNAGELGVLSLSKSDVFARSEEHTSELQSQFHLVCRLLLEKKKYQTHHRTS